MKFAISYSCGKDSTLALHKMLERGNECVGMIVMYNEDMERSWFHGVDMELLKKISESLGIPLILCRSKGENYHTSLESGLIEAKKRGAEVCVFGDIDIEDNAKWCKGRCEAVGIGYEFPLWHCDRRENTEEVISLGYECVIKCVKNSALDKSFLGKKLDRDVVELMEERGIDVCGENGEYHTIVLNGPIFKFPVEYDIKETLDFGNISAVNIVMQNS